MSEIIEDHCGIIVEHSLHDAWSSAQAQGHRGREATGLVAVADDRIDAVKWEGTPTKLDFHLAELHRLFPGRNHHTFLGHVRYATRGRKDKILEDAHPHTVGGTVEHRGNHILTLDCDAAIVHNGQVSEEYLTAVDKTLLKTGCDTEALLHFYLQFGERELLRQIPGAYTLAIADKRRKEIVVVRDRKGIMPGVLGEKDEQFVVASEDIAFRKNGAELLEELIPGTVYYFDALGNCRKEKVVDADHQLCRFQFNYIGHPDSVIEGFSVRRVRQLLGEQCAREFPFTDVDFVSYIPRCPKDAAWSYAQALGLPFVRLFYKKDAERSFQGSTPEERRHSIESNLYLYAHVEEMVQGKTMAVLEDSTVRGNVARRVRQLLRQAGAKEVRILNYTPPLGIIGDDGVARGCLYGVDMPPNDNFIARVVDAEGTMRNRNFGEISAELGVKMFYLSREGEVDAFKKAGLDPEKLCTFCTGGRKPF